MVPLQKDDVTDLVKAAAELSKNVPIYQDALRPLAKQTGQALDTVGGFVNLVLRPLKDGVYIGNKLFDKVKDGLEEKLADVPAGRLQAPSLIVAGPIFEALKFAASEDLLADLYLTLLASSMDVETAHKAHPGFVEVLKNLSPDEAKILRFLSKNPAFAAIELRQYMPGAPNAGYLVAARYFSQLCKNAGCEHVDLGESYIDNLIRLGILESPSMVSFANKEVYEPLRKDPAVLKYEAQVAAIEGARAEINELKVELTGYGRQLVEACVK